MWWCLGLAATGIVRGAGLDWPTNRFLPAFPTPATTIDCIDVSSASGAEADLFASLEGIVNRAQPRIACVRSSSEEGKYTWLNIHNLPYNLINGYSAVLKYETYVTGLVVTDPTQPDTLNLATTIAGLNDELICAPALLHADKPALQPGHQGRSARKVFRQVRGLSIPLCQLLAAMHSPDHCGHGDRWPWTLAGLPRGGQGGLNLLN